MYLEIAQSALEVYKERKAIEGIFSSLRFVLKNGRVRVLVFGPGGTGKSTLGATLGSDDNLESRQTHEYRESSNVDEEQFEDVPFGIVKVAPGQGRRRDLYWPALFRELAAGRVHGVIYVGCWGLHSFELSTIREHKLYEDGMTKDKFLAAHVAAAQQEELEAMRELAPHIIASKRRSLWMISLISKQDLWWDSRDQVKLHYERGAYNEIVASILQKRGSQGFQHEYLSASLGIVNLATPNDGVLVPTASGYDQRLQAGHLNLLHNRLLGLCGA